MNNPYLQNQKVYTIPEAEDALGLPGVIFQRACDMGFLRAHKDHTGQWLIVKHDLLLFREWLKTHSLPTKR